LYFRQVYSYILIAKITKLFDKSDCWRQKLKKLSHLQKTDVGMQLFIRVCAICYPLNNILGEKRAIH